MLLLSLTMDSLVRIEPQCESRIDRGDSPQRDNENDGSWI